jgi:hypothetical protein
VTYIVLAFSFDGLDEGTPCRNYYAEHYACGRQQDNAISLEQNTLTALAVSHHTAVSRPYEHMDS